MRTIDADAIPWEVADVGEIPVITKEEIDSMPTVEAIPVDWLLKQGKTAYASDTVEYIREVEEYNRTITDLIDKWRSERK